ncbi:hypothetical protein [Streptomyces sp. CA-251251]|uniref:hypothetical protein n=1 Tax=Streptomyces sp. CA-251251 TaxID=3240063 RepID=UPI003D923B94
MLHNPERAHPGDRPALHRAIRDAFAVLDEAVASGHVAGYGVATWAGLEEEASRWGPMQASPAVPDGSANGHGSCVRPAPSRIVVPWGY